MSYHDEKVVVRSATDEDEVYRYLRICRRCVFWREGPGPGAGKRRGHCHKFNRPAFATFNSCEAFVTHDEELNTMWMETAVRDGRFFAITYKGRRYYVTKDALVDAIGFDPDE